MKVSRETCNTNLIALLGISITALGINLILFKTIFLESCLQLLLTLTPGSFLLNIWKNFPFQVHTDIYVFNWTNHEDFRNKSTKPKFQEVGPYKMIQTIARDNITWNDDDETLTFQQSHSFHYNNETANNGNLSDQILTLNALGLLGAQFAATRFDFFLKQLSHYTFFAVERDYHMIRTANELILDGWQSYIVDLGAMFPNLAPEIPRIDRFGLLRFNTSNTDRKGFFTIKNGIDRNFDIVNWNSKKVTPYFGEPCTHVKGSMGDLYTFQRNKSKEPVYVFLPDICRYIRFDYEREQYVNGILGYKYSIGDGTLDNGTKIPETGCFCEDRQNCMPYGMLNISACRYGLEIYISLPHFYQADPVYWANIEGMRPEKDQHETYIVLEPTTAIPLEIKVRSQINLLTRAMPGIAAFEDIPSLFYPFVWMEQRGQLPGNLTTLLKLYLAGPIILNILGLCMIIAGLYVTIFLGCRDVVAGVFKKLKRRRNVYAVVMADDVAANAVTDHELNICLDTSSYR